MFRWFKKHSGPPVAPQATIAHQPPGEIFPWPRGTVLTAVDEVVLALPVALFGPEEPIGAVLLGPDGMELNVPPQGELFFLRLQPGMSVRVAKSCQAMVLAEDQRPRRIKVARTE
jgi:hypothetical protein